MGVTVDWANAEKTIVVYTFRERWDWDEFFLCWEWLKAALDASQQKVSVVMDLRATRHIPPDSLKHLRTILQQVHPNFSRTTAYVGVGALSLVYPTVLRQIAPDLADQYQAFFVSTLEEAYNLLDDWNQQQRESSQKGTS